MVTKVTTVESGDVDITEARAAIGKCWGLDRPITKAELARSLGLSPENGGDYISRLEKGRVIPNGPMRFAIKALKAGVRPDNMDDVIKPGYPRGGVV